MSVHEISAWQIEAREPFKSVGMVCSCGKAIAGLEGVVVVCSGCSTAYIISVMQLRRPPRPGTA